MHLHMHMRWSQVGITSPASCPTHAASYAGTTNVVGRQGLGRDGPGGYAAVRDA